MGPVQKSQTTSGAAAQLLPLLLDGGSHQWRGLGADALELLPALLNLLRQRPAECLQDRIRALRHLASGRAELPFKARKGLREQRHMPHRQSDAAGSRNPADAQLDAPEPVLLDVGAEALEMDILADQAQPHQR